MRLTKSEIQSIKDNVNLIFGEESKVYLFGSRIDDSKHGGDIDLFIEANNLTNKFMQKIELETKLQLALGLQKIDIIIAVDSTRLIEKEARSTGILL